MQENEKENSISLQDIFHVLWKNIILLAIITVAVTVIGVIYTFAIATPKYKSTTSIIVAVESTSSSSSTDVDYTNSLRAVVTVADTITDNQILDDIAAANDMDASDLAGMISVSNSTNSMKITISVTSSDADLSQKLATEIAQKCVDEATDGGVFFFAKDSIVISSTAQPGTYSSPNKKLYCLVSVVIGLVLGCVVIFVKEFMSTKFKTRSEIENAFPEKVLGVFPDDRKKDPKDGEKDVVLVDPSIRSFEPYNKLLSNIKYSDLENPNKVIVFTSTISNELKSTTAANLAYCMANNHHKVILLDLDLRKSVLHKTFGVARDGGIVEYVAGDIDKDALIKHTEQGVDIITSGKGVINPVAILETTKLKDLIEELKASYDYIIIDTAPSLACSDCQIISSYADGIVFSIALNQAKKKDIAETLKGLKNVDAKIIGLSITKAENKKKDYYYYYSK